MGRPWYSIIGFLCFALVVSFPFILHPRLSLEIEECGISCESLSSLAFRSLLIALLGSYITTLLDIACGFVWNPYSITNEKHISLNMLIIICCFVPDFITAYFAFDRSMTLKLLLLLESKLCLSFFYLFCFSDFHTKISPANVTLFAIFSVMSFSGYMCRTQELYYNLRGDTLSATPFKILSQTLSYCSHSIYVIFVLKYCKHEYNENKNYTNRECNKCGLAYHLLLLLSLFFMNYTLAVTPSGWDKMTTRTLILRYFLPSFFSLLALKIQRTNMLTTVLMTKVSEWLFLQYQALCLILYLSIIFTQIECLIHLTPNEYFLPILSCYGHIVSIFIMNYLVTSLFH